MDTTSGLIGMTSGAFLLWSHSSDTVRRTEEILFWRRWMVVSMDTYQHLMMATEDERSNIVVCLHLLGMIWTPMVPEEEGLPVPFCVDRRIISLREPVILSCE
jgi:hypothetical protein